MANLVRVRSVWSGTPVVGGGVSTFYWNESHSGFVADLGAFWTSIGALIAAGVTITTENTGDLIDVETGAISGSWTDGSTSIVNSGGTSTYAAGVGLRIRWATGGIRNKRRVRGSTFVVPIGTACYDAQGTIANANLTTAGNAAGALFAASEGNMRIYSRPVAGSGGAASTVLNFTIPDKVSWLRSRRT